MLFIAICMPILLSAGIASANDGDLSDSCEGLLYERAEGTYLAVLKD